MDCGTGGGIYVQIVGSLFIPALAAIHDYNPNTMNRMDLIPLAPLLVSLGMLASIILGAWKIRDLVATKSELHEVKEVIERCARKEDVESLRATLNLHISQASTAIHELRIDIGRMDEKAQNRWETVLQKLAKMDES